MTDNESVNTQPFVNASSMMYQNPNLYYPYGMPYNPAYVIPPTMTTSPSTIPMNAYPPYNSSINQPSLLSRNVAPNDVIPTSLHAMSLIQPTTAPSSEVSINPPLPETSSTQRPPEKSSNQQNSSISEYPQPILFTSNTSQNYR